jgi:hypothetical protein
METNLAMALRKFYKRTGNRVVFRNGMTLTMFAWEMAELLGGWQNVEAVDASVLSRVINSNRLFKAEHLEAFCDIVGATEEERWELRYSLYKDRYEGDGLDIDLRVSPDLVESYASLTQMISESVIRGDPHVALDYAISGAERLREITVRSASARAFRPLRKALGLVLVEQAQAHTGIARPGELAAITRPIVDEIKGIAKELHDGELFGLSSFVEGNVAYIAGDHRNSIRSYTEALEGLQSPDDRLWVRRGLALDWAYLQNKKQFERQEGEARRLIGEGHISDLERVCFALEGLARGRGTLKMEKAFEILEEAQTEYRRMEQNSRRVPFRAVGLGRTRIELIASLTPSDRLSLERVGSETLQLAQAYGLKRYEMIIGELLSR